MFRPTKAAEFEKWWEEMKSQISDDTWRGMDDDIKTYLAVTCKDVRKKIETLEVIFEMYRTKYKGDGFGAKIGGTTYYGFYRRR